MVVFLLIYKNNKKNVNKKWVSILASNKNNG